MCRSKSFIIATVVALLLVAAGLGVLIWWLVSGRHNFTVIVLEGDGVGDVSQTAAFTSIHGVGDMFWWFYPTLSSLPTARPLVLWLDGVTGLPPSLLANFGMFGPYDFNMNRRNDSWIDDYNLLYVDAPLGTGFSTAQNDNQLARTLDDNTAHLLFTMEAFYRVHDEYSDTPLYIFGQGHGAQLALSLAIQLKETNKFSHNLKGVVLGNGIISPSLALTRLGFYMWEMGYVDRQGFTAIEEFSARSKTLVEESEFEEAFDHFLTLGDFLNEEAGAIAVNLGRLTDKLTNTATTDYFGQLKYLKSKLGDINIDDFMENTVANALGINDAKYDSRRDAATQALRGSFMVPAVDKVEYILENTKLNVTIYNGNLDALSTTPGQLEWVNNLTWSGQAEFLASPRVTLIVNGLVEGYFRQTERLTFYWMNAAGQSVPLDSPAAMRRILQRITTE